MTLPMTGFARLKELAGQTQRATGEERERLLMRLTRLAEGLVFMERLRGLRGPPLSDKDFKV